MKLKYLQMHLTFLLVVYMINYVMLLLRKEDQITSIMLIIFGLFLAAMSVMLIVSIWYINIIKPLMFVMHIWMYLALFNKGKIFVNTDYPLVLFFNMMGNLLLGTSQIILISSVILKKYKFCFYLVNGFAVLIGMLHKISGFEKVWEIRSKLLITTLFFVIAIFWIGYLFS